MAIQLVIAYRIMLLGSGQPELPVEVFFSEIEIGVLNAYAKKDLLLPPQLGAAVRLGALMRGYLGRRRVRLQDIS